MQKKSVCVIDPAECGRSEGLCCEGLRLGQATFVASGVSSAWYGATVQQVYRQARHPSSVAGRERDAPS